MLVNKLIHFDSLLINSISVDGFHDAVCGPSAALHDVLIWNTDGMHDAGGIMSEIMEAEGWKIVPLDGAMETVGYVIWIAVENPALFFWYVIYDKTWKVNGTKGSICFWTRLNVPDAVRILYNTYVNSYIVIMYITAF